MKKTIWRLRKLVHNQSQIRRWPVWPWQRVTATPQRRSPGVKLMVIGLDAADWRIMTPLLREGKLPHLHALIRRGSYGRLKTLIPAQSPRLWNSLATGKRPRKHGILGFVVRHPETGKRLPYTSNMRKCKAIWDILSDCHRRVGVVGWWNTWPARPVNGAMVCGVMGYKLKDFPELPSTPSMATWEAPRKSSLQPEAANRQTYPEALFDEIRPLIRPHTRIDDAPAFIRRAWVTRHPLGEAERLSLGLLVHIHNDDRTYAEIGKFLWQKLRPDFLAVYFAGIDVVGHRFWLYMEPERFDMDIDREKIVQYRDIIRHYYMFIDELVGEYVNLADDETCVIVVSDHGMSASPEAARLTAGARSAKHLDEDGILIMAGRPIPSHTSLGRVSILDITPTLLALMGLPVGADMDGRVVKKALRREFLRQHPVRYVSTYDTHVQADDVPIESPMDEHILERLRALGYIE